MDSKYIEYVIVYPIYSIHAGMNLTFKLSLYVETVDAGTLQFISQSLGNIILHNIV